MDQEKFNQKEALGVIEEMVNKSRYKVKESAKYLLLWGWTVFVAAMLHFISLNLGISQSWLVWPVLMALSLIIYFIMVFRSGKEKQTTNYIDRVNRNLWMGILGPLLTAILVGIFYSWGAAYPVFIAIYGWSAITAGGILKFRPLVVGGVISYVLGIATFFVPGMYILIMLALAILVGFIIPGHALNRLKV